MAIDHRELLHAKQSSRAVDHRGEHRHQDQPGRDIKQDAGDGVTR